MGSLLEMESRADIIRLQGESGEFVFSGDRVCVWGNEKVLETDGSGELNNNVNITTDAEL